jgi:hypothetical protein
MNKIIIMGKTYLAVTNGKKRIVTAIILDQNGNVGPGIKTFNDKGGEVMTCWGQLREFNQAEHLFKTLKIIEEIKNFDKPISFLKNIFYEKENVFDTKLFCAVFLVAHFQKGSGTRKKDVFDKWCEKRINKLVGKKKMEEIRLTQADPAVVKVIDDYIHSRGY